MDGQRINIRAALVVGANRYSRNDNSAHLRSSVCCRRNLGVMRLQVLAAGLSATMAPRAQTGDVGAHSAPLLLSGSGCASLVR